MDLKTNIVVKGSSAKKIYETLINTSKTFLSNSTKRAERLAAFSKKFKIFEIMTEGLSFPKKYFDFVCEPYKSSYVSSLMRFN